MANSGSKKVRHVKGIGSISYDSSKEQWVGQVETGRYSNGRVKFKRFYSSNQNDVLYKMKQFKESLVVVDAPNDSIGVEEYFKSFLINVKKPKLKPASYTRDLCTWNNNVKPYIGGYYLHELSPSIIQNEMINVLLLKGLSHSTIHKAYVLTNEALKYAQRQSILKNNPCDLVDMPSKKIFTETKEIRFFNDDEINRFINTALNEKWHRTDYNNGLAIVSLIYTGLRAGELIGLKWGDINFDDNYIKVRSNVAVIYDESGRHVIEQSSTKTRKSRIVHMTKSAYKYLTELYTIRSPKKNDYVFLCGGNRDLSSLSSSYLAICNKAGIDNPQGLHTLRHTFASLMIRKGVDIKIISEMLGHASVSFTYNTYVHLLEEEKAKTIQQLDI